MSLSETTQTRPGLGRRLSTVAEVEVETPTFVTFDLGEQTFAVDVTNVREILDRQAIAALPNAASELMGMIDVRGQAIPVMDLSLPLGLPRLAQDKAEERLIVLDFAEESAPPVAIAADRVRSVVEISPQGIDPVPRVPGSWRSGAMTGVTRLDGALVYMLDLREALRMAPVEGRAFEDPFRFD